MASERPKWRTTWRQASKRATGGRVGEVVSSREVTKLKSPPIKVWRELFKFFMCSNILITAGLSPHGRYILISWKGVWECLFIGVKRTPWTCPTSPLCKLMGSGRSGDISFWIG